jgi:3-hydroxyisobutyrate dehydrogenase-like beta-hydroxyacid dehydrogenase
MVSCPQPHFDLLKPLLEQIGKVFYVGSKLGLAQTMKLANNYLSATALAATSEAVAMGVKAGLDPQTMIEVINSGSGRNSASQDKFPRSVLTGTFDFGFTSGLMMKDLVLCAEEAERVGMEMPVFDSVNEAWKAVITSQGAGSDFTAIAKHVEDKAGVKIRK